MDETVAYVILFFALGLLFWRVSLRWKLQHYQEQPLRWQDAIYGLIGIALLGLYAEWVEPHVIAGIHSMTIVSSPVIGFFSTSSALLQFFTYVVLTDFLLYWSHRLLHTRRMWPFHAFHHSPRSLNWISGMRGSPVHYLVDSIPATAIGCLVFFTGNKVIVCTKIVLDVFFQHWNHSAVSVPGARYLEYLFVTPRFHFLHHHPDPKFTDSNYGVMFSIWDRIFGTYTPPERVEDQAYLGLDYELDTPSLFFGVRYGKRRMIPIGSGQGRDSKADSVEEPGEKVAS